MSSGVTDVRGTEAIISELRMVQPRQPNEANVCAGDFVLWSQIPVMNAFSAAKRPGKADAQRVEGLLKVALYY